MEKILTGLTLLSLALLVTWQQPRLVPDHSPEVKAASTQNFSPIKTESRFQEKLIEESKSLPFKTVYQDDPDTEAGVDQVLEEGKNGQQTKIIKIISYLPEDERGLTEYSREVVGTEIIDPQNKIIKRGTKIIWKTLTTPEGEIKYWKKMRVWATHYDQYCLGCNEWTSTGARATKGVVAVDPRVIKMRTKLYIPGYGLGQALDVGGAIKGNIIDLCFDDAKTSGWSARFVDIYLID